MLYNMSKIILLNTSCFCECKNTTARKSASPFCRISHIAKPASTPNKITGTRGLNIFLFLEFSNSHLQHLLGVDEHEAAGGEVALNLVFEVVHVVVAREGALATYDEDDHVVGAGVVCHGEEVVPLSVLMVGGGHLVFSCVPHFLEFCQGALTAVSFYATRHLGGELCHALCPEFETWFKFRLSGHHELDATDGVDGDVGTVNHHLFVDGVKQVTSHLTEVVFSKARLFVKTDKQVGTLIFHHRVINACNDIHRPA